MTQGLYKVRGLAGQSPAFRGRLVAIADELGLDATAIASVLSLESGFNPAALNRWGYSGILQFAPDYLRRFGIDPANFRSWSALDQLELVRRFYQSKAAAIRDVGDHYLAAYMPGFLGKPNDWPITIQGETNYERNRTLDTNSDGIIDVGDVKAKLEPVYNAAHAAGPFGSDELTFPPAQTIQQIKERREGTPLGLALFGLGVVVTLAVAAGWGSTRTTRTSARGRGRRRRRRRGM